MKSWFLWTALSNAARYDVNYTRSQHVKAIHRLSTALQILLFLPLTLATLSTHAFLLLSLLLSIHALIHGTLVLFWGSQALSVLQVPMHPFLLLVCFNVFSKSVNPWLVTAATWWGKFLTLSGPLFIIMEGVSSLLVAQKLGQMGKRIVGEGEVYQFVMLIATAVAYVISAWWIVVVSNWSHFLSPFLSVCKAYPTAASSPLSSTLLGVALSI
jgi:hypothetical protein